MKHTPQSLKYGPRFGPTATEIPGVIARQARQAVSNRNLAAALERAKVAFAKLNTASK